MRALVLLVSVLAIGLASLAPSGAAAARDVPTCKELRARDYAMYRHAGDRAVGRLVASVSPRCRDDRLSGKEVRRQVRRGLARIHRTHDEVYDPAVLEEVIAALRASGAARIEAFSEIS